jgi:hypothetical protein
VKYTIVVPSSQNTNKFPAASPSNAPVQCNIFLFGEALLLAMLVLVLPALETLELEAVPEELLEELLEDVVGPMTICETVVPGIIVVTVPLLSRIHVKD